MNKSEYNGSPSWEVRGPLGLQAVPAGVGRTLRSHMFGAVRGGDHIRASFGQPAD